MFYIAYGSNLNLEQMKTRCPTAEVVGNAILEGYLLLFRGWNSHAVATIEREEGCSVPVLVWDIQPTDETALDRYEGYPHLYRKETLPVIVNGKTVEAMVYIMNGNRMLCAPSQLYLHTISEGYEAAGFDVGVLYEAVRASVSRKIH